MQDTRLAQDQLDAAVDFAYGGGAYRAGRSAQARTLRCLLRRLVGTRTTRTASRPAKV